MGPTYGPWVVPLVAPETSDFLQSGLSSMRGVITTSIYRDLEPFGATTKYFQGITTPK